MIQLLYAPHNEDVTGTESIYHYLFDVDTHGDERYSSRCGRFILGTYYK